MIGLARYPDKFFDLAIVDPPYGIKEDGKKNHKRGGQVGGKNNFGAKNTKKQIVKPTLFIPKEWDRTKPSSEYFSELFRVSRNQIIFGANHFISKIPIDSSCWIVWDKETNGDFADCELAWTSFSTSVRRLKYRWSGFLQERMGGRKEIRIHPTQKPVALYEWLLGLYARSGQKILDTHLGSQSSRIAAHRRGFDFWGWEIDTDYFTEGSKRFALQTAQLKLF